MGMNPSRFDRWPDFTPVRLVLVRRRYRFEQPWQGLMIDYRSKSATKWEGFVVYVDERADGRPPRCGWFSHTQLTPIKVDPNIIDADKL